LHLTVLVSLPYQPALALLELVRPPWHIHMMQCDRAPLHVHTRAHLLGRSDQHPHSTIAALLEQSCPRLVIGGVVDERDLSGLDPALLELVAQDAVEVQRGPAGHSRIQKYQLQPTTVWIRLTVSGVVDVFAGAGVDLGNLVGNLPNPAAVLISVQASHTRV